MTTFVSNSCPAEPVCTRSDRPDKNRLNNETSEESTVSDDKPLITNSSMDLDANTGHIYGYNMSEYIAELISQEPSVESIYGKFENNAFYIMTFIHSYDREARRRVYAYQKEIMSNFPKFDFDFYVLALEGKRESNLISGINCIYRRS